MRKAVVAACALLMLAGCASGPVYVQRSCEEVPPAVPDMPTKALSADVDVFVWVRAAIAELILRDAYENSLRISLYNCIAR